MRHFAGLMAVAGMAGCVDPIASSVTVEASRGVTEGSTRQAIDGGQVASPANYPTVVAIEHSTGVPFCSGVLVHASWVMTAAHCVTDFDAGDLQVIFDDPDVLDLDDGPSSAVAAVRVHPSYDQNVLEHDIALLQLAAAKTDRTATPAARETVALGTQLTTLGYGLGDKLSDAGVLHSLVTQNIDCVSAGDPRATSANLMCFDHSQGKGTDEGDSGGPTFLDAAGTRTVVSITSDGIGTVDTNTLVSHELPFIDQYVPHDTDGGAGTGSGSGTGSGGAGMGSTGGGGGTAPATASSGGCSAASDGGLPLGLMLCVGALAYRRRARRA